MSKQLHRTSKGSDEVQDRRLNLMAFRGQFSITRSLADECLGRQRLVESVLTDYRHIRAFGQQHFRPHLLSIEDNDYSGAENDNIGIWNNIHTSSLMNPDSTSVHMTTSRINTSTSISCWTICTYNGCYWSWK